MYVRCNREVTKTPVDDELEVGGNRILEEKAKKKKNQMTGVDRFRESEREGGETKVGRPKERREREKRAEKGCEKPGAKMIDRVLEAWGAKQEGTCVGCKMKNCRPTTTDGSKKGNRIISLGAGVGLFVGCAQECFFFSFFLSQREAGGNELSQHNT